MADSYAKGAAKSHYDPVDRNHLREASLAHLTRKTTEARIQRTRERIWDHLKKDRRYRPRGMAGSAKSYEKRGRGSGVVS